MSQPFKCPSCGGPLEYDGGEITVRCEFCSNLVIVPEELRESFEERRGAVPFLEQMANLKEIGRFIGEGNKIAAIKLYRRTFGVGLEEAKNAIERLSSGNPVDLASNVKLGWSQSQFYQQAFVANTPRVRVSGLKGCSPIMIVLVILVPILCISGSVAFFVFAGFRQMVTRTVTGDKKPNPQAEKSASGFAREIMKSGSDGIGPGQFKDARTVAVDSAGHIFAADYIGGRVQVFDASGKFLTQWMVDSKMPLLKLAADRKGVVYIVQGGNINRYDGMTGKSLGKVQTEGRSFDDVITTADGGLIAVQDDEDLVRMDASGRVVSTIKNSVSEQSGDSELDAKVAVDGVGNTYAMGRFNNAVFRFGPNGRFINRIGGEGNEPGLFSALNAIAVDGQGRIYVSDLKGIQVFDTNGRYLDVIKVDRGVAFGMVFNDNNELFVANRTQIFKFAINR